MPSQEKQRFRVKDAPTPVKEGYPEEEPSEISSPPPDDSKERPLVFKAKGDTAGKEKSVDFIKKDKAVDGETPKKFTVKHTTQEKDSPGKRFVVKQQKTDEISEDPKGGSKVRFSQKTVPESPIEEKKSFRIMEKRSVPFKVKKEESPRAEKITFQAKKQVEEEKPKVGSDSPEKRMPAKGGDVTFKAKERGESESVPLTFIKTEKTPSKKETISFKTRKAPPVEVAIPRSQVEKIEEPVEEKEHDRPKRFLSKKPRKKGKKFIGGFRKKIDRDSLEKYKEKRVVKGILARPILLGTFLSLLVIILVLVVTSIKNSPSSSFFWKLCFLPQIFLVIVLILGILYIVSLVVLITGVVRRFKS